MRQPASAAAGGEGQAEEFSAALRSAIRASGLTLERIRFRLGQHGFPVSAATLSYWQRGRSRPRSAEVVDALEKVLGVPDGSLTALAVSTRPRGVRGARTRGRTLAELWPGPGAHSALFGQLDWSGDRYLERLSIHEVHTVDARMRPRGVAVREVLRASRDGVDSVVGVHRMDPAGQRPLLQGLRQCRVGRVRWDDGLMAFELFLDRTLAHGETAVVEYEVRSPNDSAPGEAVLARSVPSGSAPSGSLLAAAAPANPAPTGPTPAGHISVGHRHERLFLHPVRDYLAILQFHLDRLPARCYLYTQETRDAPRRRLRELWIGTSGSAHVALGDIKPGILGVEWEWN